MSFHRLSYLVLSVVIWGLVGGCGPQAPYEEPARPGDLYTQNRQPMELLYDALHDHARDVGRFPAALSALVYNEEGPASRDLWRGPYLDALPTDPWGNSFNYRLTPDGPYPYELTSSGANGVPWDSDDYPIDEVRRGRMERDLKAYALAMVLFRTHVGRYPSTEEGIAGLFQRPAGAEGWMGPYSPKILKDPWNREFQYSLEMRGGEPYYNVWTLGRDGAPGGGDDVSVRDLPGTESFFIPEEEIERELARYRSRRPDDQPQ